MVVRGFVDTAFSQGYYKVCLRDESVLKLGKYLIL